MIRFKDIEPFVTAGSYQINLDLKDIDHWLARYAEAGPVDIDPDYQRSHVWTPLQESRWIEYLLRGGRTGRVLYWNHPGHFDDPDPHSDLPVGLSLVDGKQRLKAALGFFHNKVPAFGQYLNDFEDKDHLLRSPRTGIEMNVNYLQTRRELLQWYLDLNSGGTVHTKKELDKVRRMIRELDGKKPRKRKTDPKDNQTQGWFDLIRNKEDSDVE